MQNKKSKQQLPKYLKSILKTDLIPVDIWTPSEKNEIRPAAVLFPLRWFENQWQVLLTKRSEKLKHHSGQISFPGGGFEEADITIRNAAIRETNEELGIPKENIEIVGYLDDVVSISGFHVTPFVGVLKGSFELEISEDEVAEAFYVPLDFFLESDNCQTQYAQYKGENHKFYVYQYQKYTIWGLTAQIIVKLSDKINIEENVKYS